MGNSKSKENHMTGVAFIVGGRGCLGKEGREGGKTQVVIPYEMCIFNSTLERKHTASVFGGGKKESHNVVSCKVFIPLQVGESVHWTTFCGVAFRTGPMEEGQEKSSC